MPTAPTRQTHKNKDPRGYAEFVQMLSEHSATGHALIMLHLQAKRPTLWDMEADLRNSSRRSWCWSATRTSGVSTPACFCKRTVPTAGLCVIPRSGHTITSEEPAAFNAALADLIAKAEAGTVDVSPRIRNGSIISESA